MGLVLELSDNCGSSPFPYTEQEEEIMYFVTPAFLAVFATCIRPSLFIWYVS
jgi:hypothetical protein